MNHRAIGKIYLTTMRLKPIRLSKCETRSGRFESESGLHKDMIYLISREARLFYEIPHNSTCSFEIPHDTEYHAHVQ